MDQREYRDLINRAVAQENMCHSVRKKNHDAFVQALIKGADVNIRTKKQETMSSTFEDCLTMKGMAKFIEACLEHGAHVANFNPITNKYPIHLAAETCDVHNLQELVKSHLLLIDQKFNGCTALFMLFEMLTTESWENVFECIKVLLEQGADINTTGTDEKSPISILVSGIDSWRKTILEYCLTHYYVDVDVRMSTTNSELIRNAIQNHFPDVTIPVTMVESEFTISLLETILINDSEIVFLEACRLFKANKSSPNSDNNHETPSNVLVIPDEDLENLLFKAVLKNRLKAIALLLEPSWKKGQLFDADWIVKPLSWVLHTCCDFGNVKVLEWCLNSTSKPVTGTMYQDNLLSSIDDELCSQGYSTMLSQLIQQIDPAVDMNVCPFFQCMKLLLRDGRMDIDKKSGFLQTTALHCAANYKVVHAQELLLSKGATLRATNLFNQILISAIDPNVLEKYLDSCVSSRFQSHTDNKYYMQMDLSNIVRQPMQKSKTKSASNNLPQTPSQKAERYDELLLILNLAQSSDKKHLLQHPLIYIILMQKWLRLRIFYYTNLSLCAAFSLLFILYATMFYVCDNTPNFWYSATYASLIILLTFMGMRELFQCCLNVGEYMRSVENYVEISLIVGATYVLYLDYQNEKETEVPALIVILPALNLTLLVGSLPMLSLSTHMVMLKTVSKNFLQCFLLYAIILVTFAASFYTLTRGSNARSNITQSNELLRTFTEMPDLDDGENLTQTLISFKKSIDMLNKKIQSNNDEEASFDKFENFPLSVVKIIAMQIGEMNISDIPLDGAIPYIILLIFMFFVPIVLSNLINGLAISDIAAIKDESEIIGLVQRVSVIHKFETALEKIARYIPQSFRDPGQWMVRFWNGFIGFSQMDVNPYIYAWWKTSKSAEPLKYAVWLLISKSTNATEVRDNEKGSFGKEFASDEFLKNFHQIRLDIDDRTVKYMLTNYTSASPNR
ncbi:transient receptor potential cation channel protein painless-like isoform X1 [Anopheles darlingi]|uniref:transient receptor potential cation channel protein painless-like isoform X1 n=1 Tax=Anopheles darlingi TaxID=43151 RepID=UPI00210038FC|nr:transient receptor potential cation channel protein painless-like isoform X1 [Anopheles darlingi]